MVGESRVGERLKLKKPAKSMMNYRQTVLFRDASEICAVA
jgi:hypothetical protein